MKKPMTIRIDTDVLEAVKTRAQRENRTVTNYIETVLRHDLRMGAHEPALEVIAPSDIRDSVAVPVPGETDEERKRRDDVFFAVLDAGGY
ncbi:MAG: hypothetical protein BroJett029_05370 [Alphaproteobacteria bacterium]|nr:MAG: hypothetical protein BroJett029_05370 [Alphaproteobacteria bacterium]